MKPKTLQLSGLLAGVMLLAMGVCRLHAQASLSVGNAHAFPGTTVSVPVNVTRATNVVAAQFEIAYDTNRVFSAAASSSSSRRVVKSREIAPGLRRVVAYAIASPLSTNAATISGIPFTLAANAHEGSGPITPVNAVLARQDGSSMSPLSLVPGVIFVRPVSLEPSGVAKFFLASQIGERYLIQASTNLVDWTTLSTNTATSAYMDLEDTDGATLYPYRFYRALPDTGP